MVKLTFLGAAGSVTGSKYLVEAAGKRLLVDCGIFQGLRELTERNYQPLSIDPKTFNYVVLTHAHLDHTGWLPVLVKAGYGGPIFANPATMDLTALLLKDSAHLQEEDALHAQKEMSGRPEREPMYTSEDVDPVLRLMKPMPRLGEFEIDPVFRIVSYDAGHILGSSSLELTITENGTKKVVVFSGDIGRYDQPILNDPHTPPSAADVLICESTYGDREHPGGDPAAQLADIVNRVTHRGGSIIIPAFAIGRTQTFMYYLRQLEAENKIPRLPVYVDSPMALSATDLYLKYPRRSRCGVHEDRCKWPRRSAERSRISSDPDSGRIKGNKQRAYSLRHRVGQRNGGRRAGAAPFGAPAARRKKCRDPGGVPGTRDAWSCTARRSQNFAFVWAGCARERRDHTNESTFGARRQKRVA